jgi:transcriptional regulator with XRE-family HTH domain
LFDLFQQSRAALAHRSSITRRAVRGVAAVAAGVAYLAAGRFRRTMLTMTLPSHARGAPTAGSPAADRRGAVAGVERARLARTFGAVLAAERIAALLTQVQLSDAAGLAECTVSRLENGRQRPTISVTWRLAKALRPHADLRARVALDLRLQLAAGDSLRSYSRRPNVRRERVMAELLATEPVPVVEGDDYTGYLTALVASDG